VPHSLVSFLRRRIGFFFPFSKEKFAVFRFLSLLSGGCFDLFTLLDRFYLLSLRLVVGLFFGRSSSFLFFGVSGDTSTCFLFMSIFFLFFFSFRRDPFRFLLFPSLGRVPSHLSAVVTPVPKFPSIFLCCVSFSPFPDHDKLRPTILSYRHFFFSGKGAFFPSHHAPPSTASIPLKDFPSSRMSPLFYFSSIFLSL